MFKGRKAGDWIGVVVFALLLGIRLAQVAAGSWMALPLAVQSGLAAFLFLARRAEHGDVPLRRKVLAWLGALLPFGLQVGEVSTGWMLASLAGVGLSLWGLVSLGRSFGIAPANRGLAEVGAYRVMRHPMYAGEMLSYLALTAANPTIWNVGVVMTLLATFLMRIRWEEEIVGGYEEYRQRVRWRMIPGVW